MSICRVISWIVGNGCFLWPACSPDKTLLAFALHFVIQGPPCLLFWVSLDFLLLHSSPLWWKIYIFLVLVLEDTVGLHRTIQLQLMPQPFFSNSGWGIDLDYCVVEWFALETTEIILSFLRLHPNTAFQTLSLFFFFFFNYEGTPCLRRDSCPH